MRVSTQSWLWRRKSPRRSCRDSNSQPFDHESGAPYTSLKSCNLTYIIIIIIIIIIVYPLTTRVVWVSQMISQPVSSIFPCFPLPSGTWQTPGLSILWCCLPTSSSAFSPSPFHCALQVGFGHTWWKGDMTIPLQFASLYEGQVFVWSDIACWIFAGTSLLVFDLCVDPLAWSSRHCSLCRRLWRLYRRSTNFVFSSFSPAKPSMLSGKRRLAIVLSPILIVPSWSSNPFQKYVEEGGWE